ncbi:MAG: sulfurtransferase TusA family protein [Promethearchaeota archaeon]
MAKDLEISSHSKKNDRDERDLDWDKQGKELDLRGVQCPMTFVYTKVTLEEMSPGDLLRVILDFRSAFTNVPKNVVKQKLGKIIHEIEQDNVKTIWIERI